MLPAIKNFLFLDFETYYHAQMYTLRKMTIPEYLLDSRYETIICSVALNGEAPRIVDGPDFGDYLSRIDPETTATVTFNALFDNSILAWHYGFVPKLMLDSMNMARALRGHLLPRNNLETVCKVMGYPHDKTAIIKASGKRLADIKADPAFYAEFSDYCNRDNARSRDIFRDLVGEFPQSEMRVMDLVIRCAVQPRFMLDRVNLQAHWDNLRAEKVRLLNACGTKLFVTATPEDIKSEVTRIGLMATAGFQRALEALGVEVGYKENAAGKLIPAFAKTDQFMTDLQDHWDTRVQALACARLNVKSTIEQARTEKLLAIDALPWATYRDGNPRLYSGGECPIPLRYAGAHTHRLSGDWKLNMQNMPAGRSGKTNMLRKSLVAPPGFVCIAGDLAQIEARLVAWLAGCTALLDEFRVVGGDPYSAFASIVFGFLVNKKLHPVHRFIGKTGVLGLGYQCGAEKFYNMVLTLARLMGVDLEAAGIVWTKAMAERTVGGYRGKYHQIPALWNRLQAATETVWLNRTGCVMNVGPVTIGYGEIAGPNGLKMKYGNPRMETQGQQTQVANESMRKGMRDGRCFVYNHGYARYLMYGGKMLENIIQFLARIIIMNAALRLDDCGYRFVLQAHDELVFIVPQSDCQRACSVIHRELIRPPSWGRDIPLEAEVKFGPSYGDCK